MPELTEAQPEGTPTWFDLGIPDLDRAIDFYGTVFGWEFARGDADTGYYTICLLRGKPVAALAPNADAAPPEYWWNLHFAVEDCQATTDKARAAGGDVVMEPMQIMDQGTMALIKDPTGGQFGLWQANKHIGAQIVNEPNSLLRNDLVTPRPTPAREFYAAVFGFTLDADPNMEGGDFTFLRRPDGHEIGGVVGDPEAEKSEWGMLFAVDDVDDVAERIRSAGGDTEEPFDMQYGRLCNAKDPFGAKFSIGSPLAE